MSSSVILQVGEISIGTAYKQKSMTLIPVGELLYVVEVPETGYKEENGKKIFNIEGIRHVIKGASVALIIDSDKEDF